MSDRADFLVELGTEELPPKALLSLSEAFRNGVVTRLGAAGLADVGEIHSFATPRRLALRISQLALTQPDQKIQRRGPPVSAAFDKSGKPTRAAEAFAQSCGTSIEALGREVDPKGNECLSHSGVKPGATARELLPRFVAEALDELPIPKRMRWGAGEAQFVRPVHWLVLLLGEDVLPATILDARSGNETRGHRFHSEGPLRVARPADYERVLREGKVVADFAARRERIRAGSTALAEQQGGRALISDALLNEVTALNEWPVPLLGHFEERFLSLPRELLISVLQEHQRYFPVEDADGRLLPLFITHSNVESTDMNVVRAGNERVVRPRLSDAAFFWEQDRKASLASRLAALDAVTFQAQLGSIGDKVRRVVKLAQHIAARIGGDGELAARAAQLAKCDLVTNLVGEFPELQGLMGRYYAAADGEPEEVALAIAEHYQPRGAGDAIPVSKTSLAVALADKLDTLTGIFAIGQKPSGTKDPFALRRAAIGIGRMIFERRLPLDVVDLIDESLRAHAVFEAPLPAGGKPLPSRDVVAAQVYDYLMERQRNAWLEPPDGGPPIPGITPEACDAVIATRPRSPLDFDARLRALLGFLKLPEAASLTAANKRIANLLKKSAGGAGSDTHIDSAKLSLPAERELFAALQGANHAVPGHVAGGDYAAAFTELAQLRPAVDAFFDNVMVMDPDPALRANRLALLNALQQLFGGIADLSRLPG